MSSKSARDDIITFFENLASRRFSDAERMIKNIKEKRFGNADFRDGYVKALEGLLLSSRTGDERDFLNKAPFDMKSMEKYKKEFRSYVRNGIHSPFDVGFFLAWSDLVQYRLDSEKKP